jgi:hypothetical protein
VGSHICFYLPWAARICGGSRSKFNSDSGRRLHHAVGMDEKAIRRAALITVRRAILKRFPPRPERRAWLR